MELKQRRLRDKRDFELLEKGVRLRIKNSSEDVETTFRYDDLGIETTMVVNKQGAGIMMLIVFLALVMGARLLIDSPRLQTPLGLTLIGAFVVLLAITYYIIHKETNKKVIVIRGEKSSFSILADSPDTKTVNEFIAALHDRIMERSINLSRIRDDNDALQPEDRIETLGDLLDHGLITEHKYDAVLDEIRKKKDLEQKKPLIGFRKIDKMTNEE